MPLSLPARAVLFDMDGTLLDSTAVVETIWTDFARRFELDPAVVLGAVHGVRAEDSVARFAPAGSDVAGIVTELNAYELAHTEGTVEVPGAAAFLAALPADSVALVTSASPPLARARMAAAGLPLPATVVTAADVRAGKPAPDGYLAAAERLGVRPADAIVFEDADAGIRAGLAAGMRVVVVGGYTGPSTTGLPRLADYRAAEVRPGTDGFELVLPDPV